MQDSSSQRLILVLQANPDHQQLIQTVLAQSELRPQGVAIATTHAALDYLLRRGDYPTAPRPDLILLDLDLPGELSGPALLARIKAEPALRRIPTVVLTLSEHPDDIFSTYVAQGNCYVVKPSDRDRLTQIICRIEEFWLSIVTLPQE